MFEQPQSSLYPAPFEAYGLDQKHHPLSLDFSSFHLPADIAAPSIDSFERDLDFIAQNHDFNLQLTQVDSAFHPNTLSTCGPGSAITFSEASSVYDSSYSESLYNFSHSPSASFLDDPSFSLDVEMDFQRVHIDDYGTTQPNLNVIDGTVDPASFGTLPPTPPRSPPVALPNSAKTFEKPYVTRTSYSDYSPPKRSSMSSDYYSQLSYNAAALAHSTVSPSHISNSPTASSVSAAHTVDEYKGDPRKKYKCSACPRAFARAYNLKTHMATHDPNRLKPHVCPHRSCGRSFSRKHDLGRHLISIHRDDADTSYHQSALLNKSIGVEKGPRGWCDNCGKGYIGRGAECDCHDVK